MTHRISPDPRGRAHARLLPAPVAAQTSARARPDRHRERARRREVDGALPDLLQPVGRRGPGRDDLDAPEGQDRGLAHPPDRRGVRQGPRQPGEARARLSHGRRICCPSFARAGRPSAWRRSGRAWIRPVRRDHRVVDRDDPRPCGSPSGAAPTASPRRSGRSARPARRRRCRSSSPSCASTRSPTRTTAARGCERRFPTCSTSSAPASTPAARITTPRGAGSAATDSTAGSPAPTSRSWTTPGSTRTSAARDRSARSIRGPSS